MIAPEEVEQLLGACAGASSDAVWRVRMGAGLLMLCARSRLSATIPERLALLSRGYYSEAAYMRDKEAAIAADLTALRASDPTEEEALLSWLREG